MKRTKIICTIGPSSNKPAVISKLIASGMNAARANMSHREYAWHTAAIKAVRRAAKRARTTVSVIVDLQGPKIRVGKMSDKGVRFITGKTVVFSTDPNDKLPKYIPVDYKKLHLDVKVGERMFFDDGLMDAVVVKISGRRVSARVGTGGVLLPHKGLNLPDSDIREPSLTAKDRADARFALKQRADWVALSFVRSAKDVLELRRLIGKGEQAPKIIVKIEKPQALANFDAILAVTDAVMVARGDLGIEIPPQEVPVAQKMIAEKSLAAGKPVIVATQMLDSMIRNPRPTRAEVSDIANAVIDHADAVMLSGETATGKYPVEAVKVMAATVAEVEESHYDDLPPVASYGIETVRQAAADSVGLLAERVGAKAVVVATCSGETARFIARTRPELPIYAAVTSARAAGQAALSWGVQPFIVPKIKDLQKLIVMIRRKVTSLHLVPRGQKYILVAGKWREKGEYIVETIEQR